MIIRKMAFFILSLSILCVVCFSPSPALAAFKYNFVFEDSVDLGYGTLSGFIEFDSVCGTECTPANIIDFSFTVAGYNGLDFGSHDYQSASDVSDLSLGMAHFDVTPTEVFFNPLADGALELHDSASDNYPFLRWMGDSSEPHNRGAYAIVVIAKGDMYQSPVIVQTWRAYPVTAGVVATSATTVPEPTAHLLATLGILILGSKRRK